MSKACAVQAQQQASDLQQAVQRPLAALGRSLTEATGGVQRSFDDVWTRSTAPARQVPSRQVPALACSSVRCGRVRC